MIAAVADAVTDAVPQRTLGRVQRTLTYLVILLMCLLTAVPLYVMLLVAFQPTGAVFSGGDLHIIPQTISFENFVELLTETDALTYTYNSIVVTVGVMVLATTIACISGYILTRFEFRGKAAFSRSILLSYMFSGIVLAVPFYILFQTLGLLNSHFALVLGLTALLSPLNIWLMWQYFETVPISLEERAWIEGASRWRAVRDVVLPIARPGIVTAAIFSFSAGWNNFLLAQIVLSDSEMYTLPVGAALLLGRDAGWETAMSVSVLICIPPFLIALFFQRYLMLGINIGESG
jgi:multiple sugar transport system permease protein